MRVATSAIALLISIFFMEAQTHNTIVADSATHAPLPNASVFDRHGNVLGMCNSKGRIPYISPDCYPITIRYLGFKEQTVAKADRDTIFLVENVTALPEIVFESNQQKALHILAYVREYSTLSTYTDTVFLFREKMVDYMLPTDHNMRFRGWSTPRILKTKSYYRLTNSQGLDSVSDVSNHHFSWSDWIGIAPPSIMPSAIKQVETGSDTLRGKYSPTEVWIRNNDKVTVDVNVLADTTSRKWVPSLSGFFRNNLDFETFKVRYNYKNIIGDYVAPVDLTGYSFNIESNGRGHDMFMFNRINEPFFVSTYAEIYILDKEYITIKEAKKWENRKFDTDEIQIYEPMEAPELQPSVQALIDRVNNVNGDKIRLAMSPDERLASRKVVKQNFGTRSLQLLKTLTGISRIRAKRDWNRQWKEFKKEQIQRNAKEADK